MPFPWSRQKRRRENDIAGERNCCLKAVRGSYRDDNKAKARSSYSYDCGVVSHFEPRYFSGKERASNRMDIAAFFHGPGQVIEGIGVALPFAVLPTSPRSGRGAVSLIYRSSKAYFF